MYIYCYYNYCTVCKNIPLFSHKFTFPCERTCESLSYIQKNIGGLIKYKKNKKIKIRSKNCFISTLI